MKLFLIFCALLLAVDGHQFRFDYSYDQEADGWLKLHDIPTTWAEARLRCMREGAELASPENKQLQAAIKRVMGKGKWIFTGIHATYSRDYFYSLGGKPLYRMPLRWIEGEPNTNMGEACIYITPEGTIGATNCSETYTYVCYRKIIPGTPFSTDCGTYDMDYVLDSRTGKCYKFHPEPQQWSNAFATCSGEGGHLAIINSDTEAQVLKELYEKHPASTMPGKFDKHIVHMGFRDWADHGLWMTIHGQTLKQAGYNRWASTQPDNLGGGQFCGGIFMNAKLDDLWCLGAYPFICEKEPDSLLDDQPEIFVAEVPPSPSLSPTPPGWDYDGEVLAGEG
ncbi:C-type mannose receptor 2-like [Choristoneura fumiferana]|uniref:C-type mannose receptor 2-like n=1 Tax=Choristoneura fumiferana TaxID=7141 RepID=UPI003D1554C3